MVINAPTLSSLAARRGTSLPENYTGAPSLSSSSLLPSSRSDRPLRRVCVRYTHDCTLTKRCCCDCARAHARHQPNEGRKVHSYCINSSLSFLSRAHLNQQKAPASAGCCPPLPPPPPSGSPHPVANQPPRHSSTELNPPLASPKKPSSCFRATLEPAQSGEKGFGGASSKRVPFVPYGGLATNDSCYSFATQFSLRSTVPPARHLSPSLPRSPAA